MTGLVIPSISSGFLLISIKIPKLLPPMCHHFEDLEPFLFVLMGFRIKLWINLEFTSEEYELNSWSLSV